MFHVTKLYPDWYPEEHRLPSEAKVKGRIVGKDFQKGIGEVIIPFLEEWLDPTLIKKKFRNPLGIPVKWELTNGSQFDILTHEQDTEQFEGWHGHVAWFDEPPPRDKYIATRRGLVDYNGRDWLTLTPLTQPWIYDDIYTKADNKGTYVIVVDITDNPHISEGAIKRFEQSLTEEEKEARLRGKFMHLSGLVYKEFDPNFNICEPFELKPEWTRYFCIDPHPRTPTACLWLAVDQYDNHWVYDELWLRDMDVEQIAHAIHVQEGELKPHLRFIDPAMDKENALSGGFNIRKELMKHGVFCQRANTDTNLGKSRIRSALKRKYDSVLKTEVSQLMVFRTCSQTIYEFQHYIWDEYKRNKEEHEPKETVKKKNDHFMDCLRYIYNFGPRFIEPEMDDEDEPNYSGTYVKIKSAPSGRSASYNRLVEDD